MTANNRKPGRPKTRPVPVYFDLPERQFLEAFISNEIRRHQHRIAAMDSGQPSSVPKWDRSMLAYHRTAIAVLFELLASTVKPYGYRHPQTGEMIEG